MRPSALIDVSARKPEIASAGAIEAVSSGTEQINHYFDSGIKYGMQHRQNAIDIRFRIKNHRCVICRKKIYISVTFLDIL